MRDEREMVGTLHPAAVDLVARKVGDGLITEEQGLAMLGFPSLDSLANEHGTDKGPSEHNYTPLYERLFRSHRLDQLTLLELGIWKGASLKMWREYFPNATIIGLDRNAPTNNELQRADIVTIWADQNDETAINHDLGALYGPFNIIIDDASHISSKTIKSFQLLWPHLASGGIYVIEDLQTSYDPDHYGHDEASRNPHMAPIEGTNAVTEGISAMQWCKNLTEEVNAGLYPDTFRLGYDIASVYFEPNICVITKKGNWSAT